MACGGNVARGRWHNGRQCLWFHAGVVIDAARCCSAQLPSFSALSAARVTARCAACGISAIFKAVSECGTFAGPGRCPGMQKAHETDQARAERIFRAREEMKADAPNAMREYQEAQAALIERTRQLREQRLARERQAKVRAESKLRTESMKDGRVA
jgi:hypothetical protein